MWKVIRHRGVQAVAIAALAALATTCACLAPIYDRGIGQALLHTQLAQRSAASLALTLQSSGSSALTPDQLATTAPQHVRRFFGPPETYGRLELGKQGRSFDGVGGVIAGSRVCGRLHFVAGHCPRGMLDAAVSTADAKNFGWHVGERVAVADSSDPTTDPLHATMRVVGVFEPPAGHAPGMPSVGLSGTVPPGSKVHMTDDWVVAPRTLTGTHAPPWRTLSFTAAFPLRSTLGLDDLAPLARAITNFEQAAAGNAPRSRAAFGETSVLPGTLIVHTAIPDVARAVAHGRDQAEVTVPLLVVQLAVLAVVVFWLVLGAATEQRRAEVALARLRGRGASGARRLLLGELVPVAVVGVLAGAVLAVLASFPIRRWVLPGDAPFELRLPFWLVLAGSLAVVIASVLVATARVVREPVVSLLRRIPTRRAGWALGIVDALVVAAAAVAVVAFFTGALTGPLAEAAPTLLALLVGLLLAHLVVPLGAGIGGRLSSAGRVGPGVGLLQVARRTSTRRVIALVTVASALLVFAADAYQVGDRNRSYAAQQQLGAPMVAQADQSEVNDVVAALHEVDPSGNRVTPVVTVPSPGNDDAATVAVFPAAFRRIGLFPGQDAGALDWQRLTPSRTPAIELHGGSLTLRLSSVANQEHQQFGTYSKAPGHLLIRYDGSDGYARTLSVAPVPIGTRSAHRVHADIPCEEGCHLTGIGVAADPGEVLFGNLTLTGLRTSRGEPVALGGPRQWAPDRAATGKAQQGSVKAARRVRSGLRVEFNTQGSTDSMMSYAWLPSRIPAMITGKLPGHRSHGHFAGLGLDGVERPMTAVASAPRLPGCPPDTRLVNLTTLLRDGAIPDSGDRVQVWFAEDDPALLHRVSAALQRRGIGLVETTTLAHVRRGLDASAPAWGLLLAVLVGAAGLAIACLVLLVVAVTGWRARAKDLAALRMVGLAGHTLRRVALAEQLPIVVLAVLAGTVCGALGARYSLASVPMLPTTPEVSTTDTGTAWVAVVVAGLAALVVLSVVGWLAAVALARRATLERVREEV